VGRFRSVALLLGLLLVSACGAEKEAVLPSVGDGIAARPSEAEIVMWRGISGNPPIFDVVATTRAAEKFTVVAGMSADTDIRPMLFDEPAWSPDGETIALTADLREESEEGFFPDTDIYVVNADGTTFGGLLMTASRVRRSGRQMAKRSPMRAALRWRSRKRSRI
jgi:hypothetical protein